MISLVVSLRDVSQETEQEQRRRIADMEKDVMSVDDLAGKDLMALSTQHSTTKPLQSATGIDSHQARKCGYPDRGPQTPAG